MTRYRLGVDIGGTFTDLHLMDEETGALFALKTPSTPRDPSLAVANGIEELGKRHGIVPADVRYFAHGTTLAVNTLLERDGAKVGVLMTGGFTDTLELRRLRLPKANDFFVPKPVSLVPRRHVRPVGERMLSDGRVGATIRREDVETQVRRLLDDGVETLAVCFLHAHRNPEHERLAKSWIEESFPGVFVCISSEVWPQQREYERALVSVVNAYVGGRMKAYFSTLHGRARALGMTCRVFSTKSNGGVMGIDSAAERPVETLLSGPASGVIGAHHIAGRIGDPNIVTIDMGGTSADISILEGEMRYATENTVGDFPVIMPAVDVSAVGAGGGSIAWTDAEGVLKVGPESAGAAPGPACYGRGGARPAVTDAYLTAGIVAPDSFLGGEMRLDRGAAHGAIDSIASVLGFSRAEAADAILQIATAAIYAELLPQTARRGVDIAGFSMVAYGAAGPTQAFMLARELEVRRVVVPPSPGLLCALGCLVADFRADFVQSVWREAPELPDAELRAIYGRLEEQARSWLADQNIDLDRVYILRSADLCYVGQSYEVNVPFPDVVPARLTTPRVVDWFHARYGRVYGYADAEAPARMLEARLQIVGVTPKPPVRPVADSGDAPDGPTGARPVHEHGEEREVAVWRRDALRRGEVYEGPLVVEQYDTTVYVPAGFRVTVDDHANLIGERA